MNSAHQLHTHTLNNMAAVTLPMEMQYFPPEVAARARSYRQTITPMNGSSFAGNDRIKLVMGTTPGTYLNTQHSYLEFDLSYTTQSAAGTVDTQGYFDGHAASLIERIEVYHAGALLDTVNQVGVLYNTLMDASVGAIDQKTAHVMGGVEDWDGSIERQGRIIIEDNQAILANAPVTKTVHVAFSLIGLLSPAGLDRYLPLGDAVNGNIEIHLYLASTANGVVAPKIGAASAAGTSPWKITNVEYQAQLVEIDAAVHAALIASTGGVYTLPYSSWRQYGFNIATGTRSYTAYVSTKVSSMSGCLVTMRKQSNINSDISSSIAERTRDNLISAQLRVGALNFPLKPLTCSASNVDQAMIESLKMFGKLGTTIGGCSLNRDLYSNGGFFIGFDTQSFSAASAAVDDGLQAQHGSTYLQLEFTGASEALVVDVFVLFDGMLTVANGAISAAF